MPPDITGGTETGHSTVSLVSPESSVCSGDQPLEGFGFRDPKPRGEAAT